MILPGTISDRIVKTHVSNMPSKLSLLVLGAKISARTLSYPRKRVSSKINGFPLKDCGNDVMGIIAIKH